MCIIIDADCCADYANATTDMKPVRKWIEKEYGSVVYSEHTCIYGQYQKVKKFYRVLTEWKRSKKARKIPQKVVNNALRKLKKDVLKSNDAPIIALAIASGAKLLVTGDHDLMADFKKICKGKIYDTARGNEKLLRRDTCPQGDNTGIKRTRKH